MVERILEEEGISVGEEDFKKPFNFFNKNQILAGDIMQVSELLWELTGTPISKQKRKFKRCKRSFLAIKYKNGAVQFYGSYGVRCSLPIDQCLKCRHYINVSVVVPRIDIERYGLKEAVMMAYDGTWGVARKLFERYVLSDIDLIVRRLEKEGEVRLL